MSTRAEQLKTFLTLAGWGKARRAPLAGDASNRRYLRLTNRDGHDAVLMDAPPQKGEDIAPFISIANYLTRRGFSAPKLLGRDVLHGFLLLEDLGDDLFARVLEQDISREAALYEAATDLLAQLHSKRPPKSLPVYGPFEMAEAACLACDWYAAYAGQPLTLAERGNFRDLIEALLSETAPQTPVMALRDFHAENLLWLPRRHATRRVGLLDFQDAMLSHPAYDLASLLLDARRDVGAQTRDACLTRFIAATGHDPQVFKRGFAICSAQRNLRIMGVFARLCIRDGKPNYPDLMPRVWGNLMYDLKHPSLSELRTRVDTHLPAPSAEIIDRIKSTRV